MLMLAQSVLKRITSRSHEHTTTTMISEVELNLQLSLRCVTAHTPHAALGNRVQALGVRFSIHEAGVIIYRWPMMHQGR